MITAGILIFPHVEELDFIGPFEVLSYVNKISPGSLRILLAADSLEPVRAFNGLRVLPDTVFGDCPPLDVLLSPAAKAALRL